jgi:hypothetical protein
MTASRDELIHPIEGLPDDQVAALLADARRLSAAKPIRSWPPAFFGMGVDKEGRDDISESVDQFLAGGFAESASRESGTAS